MDVCAYITSEEQCYNKFLATLSQLSLEEAMVVSAYLRYNEGSLLHTALEEAMDVCAYLRPLQGLLEELENAEFPEVRAHVGPVMHALRLVWMNSAHYNTPERIITLLREICSLLIQQVR